MVRYLSRRLMQAVPVVVGVLLISFFLIRLVPGDPVRTQLGSNATPQAITFWRDYYGLNLPLWRQFTQFVGQVFTLHLGNSIQIRQPVVGVLKTAMVPSLLLIAYAVIISFLIALPLAIFSAVKANKWQDNVIKVSMMITFAMPPFWVALVLVLLFSLALGLLPTSGLGSGALGTVKSLTLPAITIGLSLSPILTRSLRSSVIDSLQSDYVEAAMARGLSPFRVMRRYVLRTSLLATITVVGVNLGILLGSTVIVENVFAIPGIGTLTVNAVATRDFPVVQACVVGIGLFVVLANLAADALNVALDPRIRT